MEGTNGQLNDSGRIKEIFLINSEFILGDREVLEAERSIEIDTTRNGGRYVHLVVKALECATLCYRKTIRAFLQPTWA